MGSMHAKLCLLTYPSFLRVVVTSANLTEQDWSLIGQVISILNIFHSHKTGHMGTRFP